MPGPRLRTKATQVPTFSIDEFSSQGPVYSMAGYVEYPGGADDYGYYPPSSSVVFYERPDQGALQGITTEVMEDFVGNPKGYNVVRHWKSPLPERPPDLAFSLGEDCLFRGAGGPKPLYFGLSDVPEPAPEDLRTFAWNAFYAATTQVQEQMSLGLFLWELPEIAEIPKLLTEWKSLFGSLQGLLQGSAGKFLGYQFGVQPVIGDIKKSAGLLAKLQQRLKHLRATRGKTFVCRYKQTFTTILPFEGLEETYYSSAYDAASLYWAGMHRGTRVVSHVCKAYIVVENQLSGLDKLENLLDAFSAAVGLSNPGKILWEHVPFSFVLEWFVDLDNVLRDLANNPVASPFEGSLIVRSQAYSVRSETWTELRTFIPHRTVPGLSVSETYGEHAVTRFSRHLGLPLGSYITVTGDLSAMQKALLTGLVTQFLPDWMFPKVKRKRRKK